MNIPWTLTLMAITSTATLEAVEKTDAEGIRRIDAIEFAEVDGQRLLLDLYLPVGVENPPLVVWVHGGAWRRGSRSSMPLTGLVQDGVAVASVDYRLSPVAKFPAQIHDCKAAIRFLRASADKYGLDTGRIGVAGASAGGHLAALIGLTNGNAELEGDVGEHTDQSSAIHAIVDFYGPTNFETILSQSTPHGLSVRVPALGLLLGESWEENPEVAKLASPLHHVDPKDPPLLLFHGDQDPQVPINQSHELHAECKKHSIPVHFEVVHGGAHGGEQFHDEKRSELVAGFFARHLAKASKD